jgi:hypothetical protein
MCTRLEMSALKNLCTVLFHRISSLEKLAILHTKTIFTIDYNEAMAK